MFVSIFLFVVFYLKYGLQQMGGATSSYCSLKTWNFESLWCNCNILWKKLCILCFVLVVNAVPKRRWGTKMNLGFIQKKILVRPWFGLRAKGGPMGPEKLARAGQGPGKKTRLIIGPGPCHMFRPTGWVRVCKNPAHTWPVAIPKVKVWP